MSASILLHLLMQRFSVFLVINSSILHHPLMMMALFWYSFFCIGESIFFSHFSFASCVFISNLNFDYLMKIIRRLQPLLNLWMLQTFLMYLVCL